MQINDAKEVFDGHHVALLVVLFFVLEVNPLPDRPQVVSEMQGTGGLDAAEDPLRSDLFLGHWGFGGFLGCHGGHARQGWGPQGRGASRRCGHKGRDFGGKACGNAEKNHFGCLRQLPSHILRSKQKKMAGAQRKGFSVGITVAEEALCRKEVAVVVGPKRIGFQVSLAQV